MGYIKKQGHVIWTQLHHIERKTKSGNVISLTEPTRFGESFIRVH